MKTSILNLVARRKIAPYLSSLLIMKTPMIDWARRRITIFTKINPMIKDEFIK